MRSRCAAFALGLGEYLVDTLASSHPDRDLPREALVTELSHAKDRQRFLGLRIVRAEGDEVLFEAHIFERGQDRSFAELSTFVCEDGRWRYASGRVAERGLASRLAALAEQPHHRRLVLRHEVPSLVPSLREATASTRILRDARGKKGGALESRDRQGGAGPSGGS